MEKTTYKGVSAGNKRMALWISARVVVTVMFLSCVLFIWHNSAENAAASSARSGKLTEVVNEILGRGGEWVVTEHFIRKLAHFSEYGLEGVLTVLLYMVYCLNTPYGKRAWRIIFLMGLFTAMIDESIQFFSAGRSPGLGDICIDMTGFVCGMLFMLAVCRVVRVWQVGRDVRTARRRHVMSGR